MERDPGDDGMFSMANPTSSGKRKKKTPQEIEAEVRETVANVRENSSSLFRSTRQSGSLLYSSGKLSSSKGAGRYKRALLAPFAARADTTVGKSAYATAAGVGAGSKASNAKGGDPEGARLQRETIVRFLDSNKVQVVVFLATLCALFVPDLFLIYGSIKLDATLDIIMFATLLLFTVELLLNSFFRQGYVFSFFFVLDFVALISLIPDISFIWNKIINSDQDQDNLAILRAGRLVRTGTRTSRALRLLRIVRFARLMRVFRLVRVMRVYLWRRYLSDRGEAHVQAPNRLGLRLADLLGKRVILGTILLVLVLPYLEVQRLDYSTEHGLKLVEISYNSSFDDLSQAVVDTQAEIPTCNSTVISDAFIDQHRDVLIQLGILGHCVSYLNEVLSSTSRTKYQLTMVTDFNSTAVIDDTPFEQEQAKLNIILTCLLTSLMALSSYFFNRDVHRNVVRPIRKTTTVVRKLARTLYLLSQEDDEKHGNADDESLLESHFIDSVMDQLISFFKVDAKHGSPDEKGGARPGEDSRVHPSSLNQIEQDSVLNVREDPALARAMADVQDEQIPSLSSFESLFEDKQSLQFFKVFLTSEFAVESLLFVEQVDAYKARWSIISNMHESMIRRYIDEHGQFQVNINDSQRRKLLKFDGEAFAFDLYDEARKEIYKQLERDNYPRFLKSGHAQNLRRFKKAAIARKHLDEEIAQLNEETPVVDPYRLVRIVKTFTSRLKRGGKHDAPTSPKTAHIDGRVDEEDENHDSHKEDADDAALTTRSEPAPKTLD